MTRSRTPPLCAARALFALFVLLALGCGKRSASPTKPLPSASAAGSTALPLPADHALPGEIAEGDERAFGLPLPRRMAVTARFPDAVFAAGELAPEAVANYVRQRVIAAQIETGPAKTVFLRATTRSDPGRLLRIDVIGRSGGAAELFVRDETPPQVREGQSPAERWRALGFAPDGTPLDPTHLE